MNALKRIAVLTSGGDAPGMNAAIRAVVRTASYHNITTIGIKRGYKGLIEGDFIELKVRDVGNIIQKGGTVLLTARSPEFKQEKGFRKAIANIREAEIDGLVVIGGDGSMRGAAELEQEGIPTIGIPATIDNDIFGTDNCIGVDTCLNTIIGAVDKLRDTALSHERIFVVEVMGRESGFLAAESAIAAGAESVIIPELTWDIDVISSRIVASYQSGKRSHIILVSEGAAHAADIAKQISVSTGMEVRITVLGHVQRGGSPTVVDRICGSRFGYEAVLALMNHHSGHMIGLNGKELIFTSLDKIVTRSQVNISLLNIIQNILAK